MSIMEAFGFPSAATAKSALFEEMRKVGASRLEAHYSGGNDEGGVDDIERLLDADGKALEIPKEYIEREPREDDPPYRIREGKVNEWHPLYQAVDEMLSTEFGSWAGEFSANGTIYADLKENRVWREGGIQSGYDDDSAEY